jgi:hypothetical protein
MSISERIASDRVANTMATRVIKQIEIARMLAVVEAAQRLIDVMAINPESPSGVKLVAALEAYAKEDA